MSTSTTPLKAWTRLLGTSGSLTTEVAHALTTGTDGAIYVTGRSDSDFDGQTSSGGSDAFITKWATNSTPPASYDLKSSASTVDEGRTDR